jgi:hypothetical protein
MDSQKLAATSFVTAPLSFGLGSERAATAAPGITAPQLLLVVVTGAVSCAATVACWWHMQVI